MWTEQFQSMLMLMVMSALLRVSYEMSSSRFTHSGEILALTDTRLNSETPRPATITLQQREWAEKAARNYAHAQEKKWRRWNETMFEPVK